MMLSATVIIFLSLAALSLLQKKHRRLVMPNHELLSPMRTRCLQLLGLNGLCVGAAILIDDKGAALGWVYWFSALTIAAFSQALLLSYQPRWLRVILPATGSTLPLLLLLENGGR